MSDAHPSTPETASVPRHQVPRIGPFTIRQLGLLNAGLVAVAVLGLLALRPLAPPAGEPIYTLKNGADLLRIAAQGQGPAVGAEAPELTPANTAPLRDLAGGPVTLAALRGRPVWIVYWTTWCPACQREAPAIEATWKARQAEGLVIIAIDLQEPASVVAAYARKHGLTYPIVLDPDGVTVSTYGVFGLPTHYFIDRAGVIVDRSFGELDRAQMEQRVATILGRVGGGAPRGQTPQAPDDGW